MTTVLDICTLVALLGAGLVGGVFFAFSNFVMRALAELEGREGILAMQRINVRVLNPWFLGAFVGTTLMCLAVVAQSIGGTIGTQRVLFLSASGLYVVGCFLVTGLRNVPLNHQLAAVDAEAAGAEDIWRRYLARWTLWNHVRTLACVVACLLFTLGRTLA